MSFVLTRSGGVFRVTGGWYVAGMEIGDRETASRRPDAVRLVEAHTAVNQSVVGLLDLITELDTPESRIENSVADMASWLVFDLGVEPKTARSWVRVSRLLVDLPLVREAFRTGAVSFDEVRILCRYATPEKERGLLGLTRFTPVDELSAAVREELEIERSRPKNAVEHEWLEMWWSEDESFLKLRGEIAGVDGLAVETTLRQLASRAPLDPVTGLHRDPALANAEALVQVVSEAAGSDADHDRATLVVHFNAGDLESGTTSGLAGEQAIDSHELRRLLCDSRLQPALDDPSGVTVGVGRTSRKIPAWLRRLVEGRDGGCRFPGCGRTRWTQVHHLVHWADGGATNLDNLVTLCGFHHRLIHRKGWHISGSPNTSLVFIDQWGEEYEPARPRFDPDHHERLLEHLDYYHKYRLERLALANGPP